MRNFLGRASPWANGNSLSLMRSPWWRRFKVIYSASRSSVPYGKHKTVQHSALNFSPICRMFCFGFSRTFSKLLKSIVSCPFHFSSSCQQSLREKMLKEEAMLATTICETNQHCLLWQWRLLQDSPGLLGVSENYTYWKLWVIYMVVGPPHL